MGMNYLKTTQANHLKLEEASGCSATGQTQVPASKGKKSVANMLQNVQVDMELARPQ